MSEPRSPQFEPFGSESPRLLTLEITFRGVPPLDDFVLYTRECAARLEGVIRSSARCSVVTEGIPREDGRVCYETRIQVTGFADCVQARCVDGDMYVSLWRAFDVAMRRASRAQSGVRLRPVVVEDQQEPSDERPKEGVA